MKKFIVVVLFFVLSPSSVYAIDFTITNPQVDGSKIVFDVSLSDLASNSCPEGKCYFQGGIQKGSGNHFGFTTNNTGELVGYVSSPTPEFIKDRFLYCVPQSDACSFTVSMQFNHDDPKYDGPGEYEVKLKRYSGESSSGSDSNELSISLDVATPRPSPTASPTTKPTDSPTPKPTKTPTPKPTATKKPTPTPLPSLTSTPMPSNVALGEATSTPVVLGTTDPPEADGRQLPLVAMAMIGGGAVFAGVAGVSIWRSRYNNTLTSS